MPYIGVSPQFGVRRKHTYTATASQTSFSGAGAEGATLSYTDSNFVDVYQNGVKLGDADYTSTSGTAIVLGTGATVNDIIEIIVFDAFSVADTVSKADGGQFDGAVTFAGGVSGVLDADGGITVDNITIDGTEIDLSSGDLTIDSAGNIILDAADSITTPTAGTSNVRLGDHAGNSIQSGGNYNILLGDEAGTSITTGDSNIAVGHGAGDALTTGINNVAIGHLALSTEDGHGYNVAVGHQALLNLNAGQHGYHTAVGYLAGTAMTLAFANTVVGGLAGDAITEGNNNVAVGVLSLSAETEGSKNTAVGYGTLEAQNNTSATDSHNTAVGFSAGNDINTGINNTLIGGLAGDGITSGDRNTALGYRSLSGAVDDGQYNTCVGSDAGLVTTGDQNTFVGAYDPSTGGSGAEVTTGGKNTILGSFNGNQSNLDIRTSSNNIVISDGDGFPDFYKTMTVGTNGTWFTGNRTATAYWPHTSTGNALNGISLQGETGTVGITSNSLPLYINRNTNDGGLIYFYATGNNEGNISVSGTTVSYNGGHLSRWSQLSDGSKDTTIVKGTVMTNLDQMAVWKHKAVKVGDDEYSETGQLIGKATEAKDAYTEDNEQLNCMAVSNVEGDVNVAGVFVNWDYIDDGFIDMNIAMTGDMVIRIAKGTTVARGDLLMSAGDGTAKPQGDDIVRSKTIAKVTSTNVSHTYDDGTYLVPCVLMAC